MEMKNEMKTRIVIVTGELVSEEERIKVVASIGVILKNDGFKITIIRCEPDGRADSTLSSSYGEKFILDDGSVVDQNFGSNESLLTVRFTSNNYVTMKKIFENIIEKEERGDYDGNPIDGIDQITEAITELVENVAKIPIDGSGKKPHVCIVDFGGRINSSNGATFVEAFSRYQSSLSRNNLITIHVTSVFKQRYAREPDITTMLKNLEDYEEAGLSSDLVIYRSKEALNKSFLQKICSVALVCKEQVIGTTNIENIYQVVDYFYQQKINSFLRDRLELEKLSKKEKLEGTLYALKHFRMSRRIEMEEYLTFGIISKRGKKKVHYKLINDALTIAGNLARIVVKLCIIYAEDFESDANEEVREEVWKKIKKCQGIIIPGEFDQCGFEGKILVCQYARENKIPFLGICMGMQCAVIEFARNVVGIKKASTIEIDRNISIENQLVIGMPEHYGGKDGINDKMRRGLRGIVFLTEDCTMSKLYNKFFIWERHYCKYEINPKFVSKLIEAGLTFVGIGIDESGEIYNVSQNFITEEKLVTMSKLNESGNIIPTLNEICTKGYHEHCDTRMEILEIKNHPYFVGCQFYPEYLSNPASPSPPFVGLLMAASGKLEKYLNDKKIK